MNSIKITTFDMTGNRTTETVSDGAVKVRVQVHEAVVEVIPTPERVEVRMPAGLPVRTPHKPRRKGA